MTKRYALLLCLCISFTQLTASTIYVDLNATFGLNNGSSWADAYTDLQNAIDVAIAGDDIWVAAGTYHPTKDRLGSATPSSDKLKTFYISTDGIAIYGGFVGTETALAQRDIDANTTTLSGDFNGDDVVVINSWSLYINNNSENAYNVVLIDGTINPITSATVLNGFTVTGGAATGSPPMHNTGGGILNWGVYNGSCNPTISHCTIIHNQAASAGGMFSQGAFGESSPTIQNCTFIENKGDYGGGMYNGGYGGLSVVTITNCAFIGNRADIVGGAMMNDGRASGYSDVTITSCTFIENSAWSSGRAIHYDTNGGSNNSTIINCIFWDNEDYPITLTNGAVANMTYSIYQDGNVDGILSLPTGITDGGNNLDAAPSFVDAANGNFNLSPCSPALDSGNDAANTQATDLVGNTRIQGSAIDRGAHETSPYTNTNDIFYVNINATAGLNNGTSWADAFIDLQDAINLAFCGDQIWVAAGTYHPTVEFDASGYTPNDVRNRTFYISRDDIALYGGFAGTETMLSQRDAVANPTILSGDFNGDDGTTGIPGTETFDLTNNTENAYHVVIMDGSTANGPITAANIIDGFQITGGHADGGSYYGGGLRNNGEEGESSPTIVNCTFSQNKAYSGGGVFNNGYYGTSNVTLTNCNFVQNVALYGGAGIYRESYYGTDNASLILGNCHFSQNITFSGTGGGISNYTSDLASNVFTLTDCSFSQNVAEYGGAGIYHEGDENAVTNIFTLTNCSFTQNKSPQGSGGGIDNEVREGDNNMTLNNCTFIQNEAEYSGGGISNEVSEGDNNMSMTNCTFSQNITGYEGGAMINEVWYGTSNPVLTNCSFSQNITGYEGGAMINEVWYGTSNPVLTNCTFSQNEAILYQGGAMVNTVWYGTSNPVLTNCTFSQNTAPTGSGIYNYMGNYNDPSNPTVINYTIQNCIFWGTGAGNDLIVSETPSSASAIPNQATGSISYSIYDDGTIDNILNLPTDFTDGGNNLDSAPLFMDATTDDLSLAFNSPAIDGGNDAFNTTPTDVVGNPRIENTIDMGAYERTPPVIAAQPNNQVLCLGENASFTTTVAPNLGLLYQWQEDTGAGFAPIADGGVYSGATTHTLQLTSPNAPLNNAQYQCVVTGGGFTLPSTVASLMFSSSPSITTQPMSVSGLCPGDNTSFTVASSHTNSTYQWQVNLGSGFLNMSNASIYNGITSPTLMINGVISGLNSYQYRCVVTACSANLISNAVNLNVDTSPLTMNPVATYTAVLNPNKTASVSLNDLLNTPLSHPCGIASQNITGTSNYTCVNIGATYPVTLTAVAGNGATVTATVMVSVTDPNDYCCAAPQALCNSTIPLSLTGNNVTLDPTMVMASSIVPCGIQSVSLSQSVFDCSHIGTPIPVTFTLTDNQNQATTCNTTVVVTDGADPIAMCVAPFDIYLDATGNASITTAMINNGSMDNCTAMGDLIIGISQTDFDCTDEGMTHAITLTVEDEAGRISTCTTMVTVLGNAAEDVATRSVNVISGSPGKTSLVEGDSGTQLLDFTVYITNPVVCTPLTVDYTTSDNTTTAGTDYVAQSGTLTFAQGENYKTINVVVNGDLLDEGISESLYLILSNPTNGVLGADTATAEIMDDDDAPTVSITSMESVDENVAGGMANFTITLSQASGLPIAVFYQTADGTATAGMDYTETNGTVDIPAGSLTGTINIPITDDMDLEGDETFTVTLGNPINVELSTDIVCTATIVDNETADADGDNTPDDLEQLIIASGCTTVDASTDCDGDNVLDIDEIANGTDPLSDDTDGDGVLDNVDSNPTNSDDPTPNASNCKIAKITVLTPTPVCDPATGTYSMSLRVRHKNANQSAFNKLKVMADNGTTTETFLFPVQTGGGNINQIVNLDLIADGINVTFTASFLFDDKCDKSIIFAGVPGACAGSAAPPCSINSEVLLVGNGVNAAAGTSYTTVSLTTDIAVGSAGVFSYNWATVGYVRFSVLGDGELSVVYEPTASWTVTITDVTTQCVSIVTSNGLANVPNVGGIIDIVSIVVNAPLCDSANGAITVEADEGSGEYEFIWSTGFIDTDDDNNGMSTLTGLTKGWYEVIVMDVVTNESASEWVWVPCSNNAGGIRGKVDLTQETLITNIAPNPFEQTTTISLQSKTSQTVQVNILRLNGQVVAELFRGKVEANTIQPLQFEADHLPQGLYLLQVIEENGSVQTEQLLLQR